MQSIFRLPWSAETSVDRAAVDSLAFPKPRHTPLVDIPFINKGKRKAADLGSSPTSLAAAFDGRPLKKAKVPSSTPVAAMRTPTTAAIGPPYASPLSQNSRDIQSAVPSPSPNPAHRPIQPTPPRTESSCASHGNASDSSSPVPTIEPTGAAPAAPNDPQPRGVNVDKLSKAQCVIQSQFDLEIMMKHEELRRIDQELAKCQVALEQLRRCRIIPYPSIKGFSEGVTDGKGPSLAPPAGHTKPSFPSPWGVTDGPYSRHYAAWLLKDPSFDPYPVQYVQQSSNARDDRRSASDGRTTRGSGGELSSAGFARTSRTSTGSKHAFGAGDQTPSAPPKDPLVFRRQADGKLVRLSCNKCLKDQFANVQGFINHYRIQHHYGFRSHEAAAVACGKVIDESEAPTPGAPTPAPVATPKETVPKPVVASGAGEPLVHPLINNLPARRPIAALVQDVLDGLRADPKKFAEQTGRTTGASPFTPSNQTPRLSAMLQNRGFSGDLGRLVADATVRYEDSTSYDPSEDEAEAGAEMTPNPSKVKRVPPKLNPSKGSKKRGGMSPAAGRMVGYPADKKRKLGPLSPSLASPPAYSNRAQGIESPVRDEADLSPNTVESNPGLVSDYEDDDDDYNASSHAQTDEEEADLMDVDIEDHSDIDRGNGLNRIGRHRGPTARK